MSDIKSIDPFGELWRSKIDITQLAGSVVISSVCLGISQLSSFIKRYRSRFLTRRFSNDCRSLERLWIFDLPSDRKAIYIYSLCVCGRNGAWAIGIRNLICSRDDSQPLLNCFTPFGANSSSFCACETSVVWCISYKCMCVYVCLRVQGEIVDFVLE